MALGRQTYSIKLRLDIDDTQLSKVESRLEKMKAGTRIKASVGRGSRGGGSGGGRGSRGGVYQSPTLERRQLSPFQALVAHGIVSPAGLMKGRRIMARRWMRFDEGFLSNLTSTRGLLFNVTRFAGIIGGISTMLGRAIPILGGAMSVLRVGTKVGFGITAYRIARGALPVLAGMKLLNNENLGNAASQLMQMRMAQKGLGPAYSQALNSASEIAATFGFSRAGILSAINMFSGLSVGGKQMSIGRATKMAETIGKISHVGGLPYERVNINMQQLFGQQTPNGRDLRELITAVPLLGKIAQQAMKKRTGAVGNIYDYLKDKLNLMNVLNEFDKQVETSPFLQARGKVALAKENFFMDIVGSNTANWKKIADGASRFFENIAPLANMVVNAIAQMNDTLNIDVATAVMYKWARKIGKFLGLGNDVARFIAGYNPETNEYRVTRVDEEGNIITESKVKGSFTPMKSIYAEIAKGEQAKLNLMNTVFPTYKQLKAQYPTLTEEQYKNIPKRQFLKETVIGEGIKEIMPAYRFSYNVPINEESFISAGEEYSIKKYKSKFTKSKFEIDTEMLDSYMKALNDSLNFGTAGGDATGATQELENLSKGARAVVINFNKEIVAMPVHIEQVNDGTDFAQRVINNVRREIIEGLNIALNNATGVAGA